MKRMAGHAGWPAAAPALTALIIVACGGYMSGDLSAVPPEFQPACGHPGAEVVVSKVPVTVNHADCDLTGVVVSFPGRGGATVPAGAGAGVGVGAGAGLGTGNGFTLTVHPGTLDVTVNVTGPAGNAYAGVRGPGFGVSDGPGGRRRRP
jgi:hypothetical protein